MIRSKSMIVISLFAVLSFALASFAQQEDVTQEIDSSSRAYSTALSERPFTLPAGVGELGGHMRMNSLGKDVSLDLVHLNMGITNNLQFGISWAGMPIPSLIPERSLTVSTGYFLFGNNWIASMASLDVPVHLDGALVRNLRFSMPTVFPVISGISFMGFYDSLVDFEFSNQKYRASMNFPVKLSLQVTKKLALDVSSRVAQLEIDDQGFRSHLLETIPLRVGGLFAIANSFDIFAAAGCNDVNQIKDTLTFSAGIQFRVGNLDG